MGEIIVGLIGALGIGAAFLKYRKALKIVKEVAELVATASAAIEDGKLTAEEAKRIWKELQDVVSVFK